MTPQQIRSGGSHCKSVVLSAGVSLRLTKGLEKGRKCVGLGHVEERGRRKPKRTGERKTPSISRTIIATM